VEIRGLGSRLRHGYDALDHELIWDIITRDLAPLRSAVAAMMEADDGAPKA
jgi:uncharacterized protein with HEPN domain